MGHESRRPKLGPTGEFPKGRLSPDDEGEIRIAVVARAGKVLIDFGTPVKWIGFDPAEARGVADALNRYAAEAEAQRQ